MDAKLSWRQYVGLKLHLCICRWCRRYANQTQFLRDAAPELEENSAAQPSIKLSAEARERIRERLSNP